MPLPLTPQEKLFRNPHGGITKDIQKIYKKNQLILGVPRNIPDKYKPRKNTIAVVGAALGDEGKGRLVDNKIEALLKKRSIKKVYVVRFQGGNNTGHTVEKGNIKLALHLVPAGIMYKDAIGIMDRGMVIHVEDLQTEVNYIEEKVGSLHNRLYLSDEAILCTDLERAEEVLNRIKTGRAHGGTGRGISPAYAHHYDRLGLKIYDLLDSNWETTLSKQYDQYHIMFKAFNTDLPTVDVPDFNGTVKTGKETKRTVGSKKEFLQRMKESRDWLLKRNIVRNIFLIHQEIFDDLSIGVIFEGAQALGLSPWLGTRPDTTSSNTSLFGISEGTAYWLPYHIEEKIGTFKILYTSSVGARRMPTHVDLPKDLKDLPKNATPEQKWAAFVRETAYEYGTTTGRPRDITHLDLTFLTYNARMSGVEVLAGTHLDIAREDQNIKVCTHYIDKKGNVVSYQPGLRYQKDVIPNYVELPGWDGKECEMAKKASDLPENALKFLSFIQKRTGYSIVAVTTGPQRENFITLPGYF